MTPQEETKIKKIEDATEAARNKLRNHHIYGVSLKFFRDFFGFYRKFPGLVPGPGLKATEQSEPGKKSAGQSRY